MNKNSKISLAPRAARTAPALTAAVAMAALLATGCSSMSERERGTAGGAGIGAVAGAVIGSATGGKAGSGAVVGGALGAVLGNVWSKRQEERRVKMEQATRGTGVEVTRTADNQLKLNIPNDVSFDFNSATIRPEMRSVLDPFVNELRGDPNARVAIVGHGTGKSSAMAVLSERLHERHPGTEIRVVATATVDLSATTDGQLLALGREMLALDGR